MNFSHRASLLASSFLLLTACEPGNDVPPSSGAPAGYTSPGVADNARVRGAPHGTAASQDRLPRTTPVPAPGGTVPARVLNLFGGASAITMATPGGGDVTVPWLGFKSALALPAEGPITVDAEGVSELSADLALDSSGTTQVVVYGHAVDGLRALALTPATETTARLRVVNASPHLGTGDIYTTGCQGSDSTKLAPGQASPWRVLATDALSAAEPIRVHGWMSGRTFKVTIEHAITEPTTLLFTTNADEELVVVGVTDGGHVFVEGPIAAPAEVRFAHFASGVGPVDWRLNGQPLEGLADALPFRSALDYVQVAPSDAAVITASAGGHILASLTVDLPKFGQRSFTLAGSLAAPVIVEVEQGQVDHPDAVTTTTTLHVIDARPVGAPPFALFTRAIDVLDAGAPWLPLLSSSEPSKLTQLELEIAGQVNTLLGVDFDRDGTVDETFGALGMSGAVRLDYTVTIDDEARPWLSIQWNDGAVYSSPTLERTTWLRLWNLDHSEALALASDPAAAVNSSWPSPVYRGQVSYLTAVPDGAHSLTVGGETVDVTLPPMQDITFLALADGSLLSVATEHPVGISTQTAQLVNLSEAPVAARLVGGPPLGQAIAPRTAGPEGTAELEPGSTLEVTRADGSALTFTVHATYGPGATLLVYGGPATWPTLSVLQPGGQPMVVHPNELSATIRVFTAFAGTGSAVLSVDGLVITSIDTNSWGTEKVSVGGSGTQVVPSGAHTLTLASGEGTVNLPVDLTVGALVEFMVFPDGAVIELPPLDPLANDIARVINATSSTTGSSLFVGKGAAGDALWVEDILPGTAQIETLAPGGGLVSVDYDLDGTPDWRQGCGLPNSATVIILGNSTGQAVAQFYGDGSYPILVGKKIPAGN